MVSVSLILNGSPQKIVQRCQITAPRRLIDIRISADYSIFEKGVQKIDFYVVCVATGPVLLKPNVIHVILFNFWKHKFVQHCNVTLAIDRDGGSLLIFEKKLPHDATVPKPAPNSHSLWVHRLLNDNVLIFWAPNATILLIHIASDVKIGFLWKDYFWVKMLIFDQAIFSPLGEPKTHQMVMIQFHELTSQIDLQTAMKVPFFVKFFS